MSSGRVGTGFARRDMAGVAALVVSYAAIYGAISLFHHWRFGTSYDLAIFDQAIWHLSRLEAPASSVRGVANLFGDHFHPILLTLVPFYWIAPAAEALLVAQAALLALSIVPVHAFCRDRFGSGHALALAAAYGAFWGLQRTALSDFHEVAFAPLFVAMAILALSRAAWPMFYVSCALLCLVKEDLIPFVAGIGLYLVLSGHFRQGIAVAAGALTFFVLVVRVIIPWLNPVEGWVYGGQYGELLRAPWTIPMALVTPFRKFSTVLAWLAPFAFLSLRSPIVLLAVPIAIGRLLSPNENHWGYGGHYSAALAPILAMAAADGLFRLLPRVDLRRRGRTTTWVVSFCVVACLLIPGHQPMLRLVSGRHYEPIPTGRAASEALAMIPPEASVVAQAALAPHLAHRESLYLLDERRFDADFVIASEHLSPWPMPSIEDIKGEIDWHRRSGHAVVYESDGWIVLRREAGGSPVP